MIELTGKQKSRLRSLGQALDAAATVGKAGMAPAVVAGIAQLMVYRELIKVHIPAGSGEDRRRIGEELAAGVGGVCVSVVGRMVLLYRPNPELPYDKRVDI